MYATLSHSHLLLVLLSWLNGADWKLEDEPTLRKLLNANGAFCDAAVAAFDDDLDRVLRDGLLMEVLSWKMMVEEPTAASLISQALNAGHHFALRTSELSAMSVLAGTVTIALGSAVAGEVCFETVREKVRTELGMHVDVPGFTGVFEFVVNMGAKKNILIPQLLDFGSKFVDQSVRQLGLPAFAEVSKVGLEYPRVKIAIIMRAYRKAPNKTWCPPPEPRWNAGKKISKMQKLETLLR